MNFTATQIRYLLKLIAKEHGDGYAPPEAVLDDGSSVGSLQAHLSIQLEMAVKREGLSQGAAAMGIDIIRNEQ